MPRKFLRRLLPNPQRVREHRLLAGLGSALHHPHLWHISREGIARGAAIGGFFGLIAPLAQIPLAAIFAIFFRANLPMAVAGTLITNPFTFAPIYLFAYKVGLFLTGNKKAAGVTPDSFDATAAETGGWLSSWIETIAGFGKPLFIGLFVLACMYALLNYFGINWTWRLLAQRAWRQRSVRRKARAEIAK